MYRTVVASVLVLLAGECLSNEWTCCPPCGDGFQLSCPVDGQTLAAECPSKTPCPAFAYRGCWNGSAVSDDAKELMFGKDEHFNTKCSVEAQMNFYKYFAVQENISGQSRRRSCLGFNSTDILHGGLIAATPPNCAGLAAFAFVECPNAEWFNFRPRLGQCVGDGTLRKNYTEAAEWCAQSNSSITSLQEFQALLNDTEHAVNTSTYWLSDGSCAGPRLGDAYLEDCKLDDTHNFYCIYNDTSRMDWSAWTEWSICTLACGQGNQTRSRYRLASTPKQRLSLESRGCPKCPWSSQSGSDRPKWAGCYVNTTNLEVVPGVAFLLTDSVETSRDRCAIMMTESKESFAVYKNQCYHANKELRDRSAKPSRGCAMFGSNMGDGVDVYKYSDEPIPAGWGAWTDWDSCTLACGKNGTHTRTRECNNPSPAAEQPHCTGNNTQTESCNVKSCPVINVTRVGCIDLLGLSAEPESDILDGANSSLRMDFFVKCKLEAHSRRYPMFGIGANNHCEINKQLQCIDSSEIESDITNCPESSNKIILYLFAEDNLWSPRCSDDSVEINVERIQTLRASLSSQSSVDTPTAVDTLDDLQRATRFIDGIAAEEAESSAHLLAEVADKVAVSSLDDAKDMVASVAKTLETLGLHENQKSWAKSRAFTTVIESVEKILLISTVYTDGINREIHGGQIMMQSDVLPSSFEKKQFDMRFNLTSTRLSLPPEAISKDYTSVVAVLYTDYGPFLGDPQIPEKEEGVEYRLGTILTLATDGARRFSDGVATIHLPVNRSTTVLRADNTTLNIATVQCVYWHTLKSLWLEDGCVTEDTDTGDVLCKCNHLTSFAVLMRYTDYVAEEEMETTALTLIGYIGIAVSLFCLITTFSVFIYLDNLTTERKKIHMNLIAALGMAQLTYAVGIDLTQDATTCTIIAVLLHLFYMATFTWMLCEGIHLYFKIVAVFDSEGKSKKILYYVIGWGFPVIIVAVSCGVNIDGYGHENFCWLSVSDGLIWAFVGPVCAVVLINFIIMALVIKIVVTSAGEVARMSAKKQKSVELIKAGVKGVIILTPILGINWLFGLLAVNKQMLVFEFLFVIINSLQGLLIFLAHCVGSSEVRTAFRRKREQSSRSKSIDNSVSHDNVITPKKDGWMAAKFPSLFQKGGKAVNEQQIVEDILHGRLGKNMGGIRHMVGYANDIDQTDEQNGRKNATPSKDRTSCPEIEAWPLPRSPVRKTSSSMSNNSKRTKVSEASTTMTMLELDAEEEDDIYSSVDRPPSSFSWNQSVHTPGYNDSLASLQTDLRGAGRNRKHSQASSGRTSGRGSMGDNHMPSSPTDLPGLVNED